MSVIVPLDSVPEEAIERVLDDAFGADRRGRTAYLIRAGMSWLPSLSFGVIDEGELIGSLQSWPVALTHEDGTQTPLVMVGPVAVAPSAQGGGHGRALMDNVIRTAREQGSPPLMMIGDPEYYGRFWGFSAEGTGEWNCPGPFEANRLLALSIDGRKPGGKGMLGPRIAVSA